MSGREEVIQLLESSIYCTIASVNDDNTPWISPVFFGYDEACNLYWRSAKTAQHSQNLATRPNAAITVFNSQADWGEGTGLYVVGRVEELQNENAIQKGLDAIDRRSPKKFSPQEFLGDYPRRIYKLAPTRFTKNITVEKEGQFVDMHQVLEVTA